MDQEPAPRRNGWWPVEALVLVAALPAVLVVVFFDDLEGVLDGLGIDGGIDAFALLVVFFVLAWTPAILVLRQTKRPQQNGLWAGIVVACVIAVRLVVAGILFDDPWVIPLIGIPFVGLTLLCAVGAGLLASATR